MRLLRIITAVAYLSSLSQAQDRAYADDDYQDYGDYQYGQEDNLYADYAQRQELRAAGG